MIIISFLKRKFQYKVILNTPYYWTGSSAKNFGTNDAGLRGLATQFSRKGKRGANEGLGVWGRNFLTIVGL
jgi:hypothetical protein